MKNQEEVSIHPLQRFREYKGLSQKEFAEKVGITQGMMSNYERRLRIPTGKTLQKLRTVFPELNPDFIIEHSPYMLREDQLRANGLEYQTQLQPKEQKDLEAALSSDTYPIEGGKIDALFDELAQDSIQKYIKPERILRLQNATLQFQLREKDAQIAYLKTLVNLQTKIIEGYEKEKANAETKK